jgi:hypothetical protein
MTATQYTLPVTDEEREELIALHAELSDYTQRAKKALQRRNQLMRRLHDSGRSGASEMSRTLGIHRSVVQRIVTPGS